MITGDPNKYSTTPNNSACKFFDGFIDNGDGTITDPRNNLIWMRCSDGSVWSGTSCKGSVKKMNWFYAMQAAKDSRFLGRNDWRLPTAKELRSVLGDNDHACDANSFDQYYAVSSMLANQLRDKNGKISSYWSSTSRKGVNIDPDEKKYGKGWWEDGVDKTPRVWQADFETAEISSYSRSVELGAHFVRSDHDSSSLIVSEYEKEYKTYDVASYVKKAVDAKAEEEKRKTEQDKQIAREKLEQERRGKAELTQYQSVLNNKNPQLMYLAAGKYARNGDLGKAQEIYEHLIDKYPNSAWAVKASDQLSASKRDDDANTARSKQIDRASGQCRERIANCNWSCTSLSTSSARDYCRGQCTSLCSP